MGYEKWTVAQVMISVLSSTPLSNSWIIFIIWGFPIIRGTLLGLPILRIIVFWGLY